MKNWVSENYRVSIVTPFLNLEKFLDKCIRSVIDQTYLNWELVLIDSGSHDNSYVICEKYLSDKRIHLFKAPTIGASVARNIGLRYTRGEYIFFLDGDDWIPSDCIENMLKRIVQDGSDFCVGSICRVLPHKNLYSTLCDDIYSKGKCNTIPAEAIYLIAPKLFKRSIIADNGIAFNEDVHHGEDGLFCMEYLLKCSKISTLSNCCYYYNHLFMIGKTYGISKDLFLSKVELIKRYKLLISAYSLSDSIATNNFKAFAKHIFEDECVQQCIRKDIEAKELLLDLIRFKELINSVVEFNILDLVDSDIKLLFNSSTIYKSRRFVAKKRASHYNFVKRIIFKFLAELKYIYIYISLCSALLPLSIRRGVLLWIA